MTGATPVERIVALLTATNFRRVDTPIVVAGVKFDFDAVLVATASMPDIVLVIDTTVEHEDRVRTKIESFAQALDVVRSKRPLTVILAGPRPITSTLVALARVCRVLPVGTPSVVSEEAVLRNWLSILMPLNLPQASDAIADPTHELLEGIEGDDPIVADLIAAAPRGAEQVSKTFHRLVSEPLDEAEETDRP